MNTLIHIDVSAINILGDTRANRMIRRHAKLLNNVTEGTLWWNYPNRSFHDFINNELGVITRSFLSCNT
jgi:hypothetical protein